MVNQSKRSCLKSKVVVPPGTVVLRGVCGGISTSRHRKNDSSQTFKGCEEEEEEREEAGMGGSERTGDIKEVPPGSWRSFFS